MFVFDQEKCLKIYNSLSLQAQFRQLLDRNGVTDDDNRSSVGIFILMKISRTLSLEGKTFIATCLSFSRPKQPLICNMEIFSSLCVFVLLDSN